MTDTVKGAGRRRAAARTQKTKRNEQRLEEVKRDEVTGNKPTARRRAAAKKAPAKKTVQVSGRQTGKTSKAREVAAKVADESGMHAKVKAFMDEAIKQGWSVEYREDDKGQHLRCTRGKEVLTIFWLAGVYQRWAEHTFDGGKPQRVPNAKSGYRVLEATEQQAAAAATKKRAVARKAPVKRVVVDKAGNKTTIETAGMTVEEKIEVAMAERGSMVWEEAEMTDDELVEFFSNRSITWVNSMTGSVHSARFPKEGKHTKITEGKSGRAVEFASTDGPFVAVRLSSIITVS